jgi:HSP20 family protein
MLTLWNPVMEEFVRLQKEVDRAFDGANVRTARRTDAPRAPAAFVPPVDIEETANEIVVRAELPGVKKDDLSITLDDNVLVLAGERKWEHEARKDQFVRRERRYGAFTRSFTLPPTVDAEKIAASMVDGVLTLTLPKRAEAQPRKIQVS